MPSGRMREGEELFRPPSIPGWWYMVVVISGIAEKKEALTSGSGWDMVVQVVSK